MATILDLKDIPVIDQTNLVNFLNSDTVWADGFLFLIDKPNWFSSFKVIGKLRVLTGYKKIGHAGTLDPMATGLVICCTGKATKSISHIQEQPKVYHANITFGASTPSYDAETPPDAYAETNHITQELISSVIYNHFNGIIEQIPPMYSALKKQGQPLYKLARKGKTVERNARNVSIHNFKIVDYKDSVLSCIITCSKGTYIRSIAHDLGLLLNSRAHLTALRRTRIGNYNVDDALTFDIMEKY